MLRHACVASVVGANRFSARLFLRRLFVWLLLLSLLVPPAPVLAAEQDFNAEAQRSAEGRRERAEAVRPGRAAQQDVAPDDALPADDPLGEPPVLEPLAGQGEPLLPLLVDVTPSGSVLAVGETLALTVSVQLLQGAEGARLPSAVDVTLLLPPELVTGDGQRGLLAWRGAPVGAEYAVCPAAGGGAGRSQPAS